MRAHLLDRLSASVVFRAVLVVFLAAVLAAAVVVGLYAVKFGGPLSDSPGTWGQFGDFMGGSLNPLVSLFALGALLLTIVLQTKEMEATREELRRSAAAQESAAKSTERQSAALEMSNRLAALTTLVSHADSWYSSNGHVPRDKVGEYQEWVNEHRPRLVAELKALYESELRSVA